MVRTGPRDAAEPNDFRGREGRQYIGLDTI